MNVSFLDLKRSYAAHREAFEAVLGTVAGGGAYILGPHVRALEHAAARYLGVRHAVGCASGTDALHLAVTAAGIGPGDEVITTPFTFAATLESIQYAGATPVLADIDPGTFNLDPSRAAGAITDRTRAIMPVHLFGLAADMQPLLDLAAAHALAVIEDAAQSLGGRWQGRQTGSIGTAGAFSFYPSKTLGCFGDGGMVACNDDALHERLLALRNHGLDPAGEHVRLGYNSRLDEMQAAVLGVKLPHLDDLIARRRAIAAHYNRALAGTAAEIQTGAGDCEHAYGYYTICVPDRDALQQRLSEAGVATALYYRKALHRHAHYARSCRWERLPVAEDVSARCLSLPIYPEMTDAEVEYVASAAARALGRSRA